LYLEDRQRSGHITSPESVRTYRFFLDRLASDVGNRDPSLVGYQDIKRTLARWPNPNTYGQARTAINGMFKWLVAEGYVKTNPVDRIQAPRKKRVTRARLTKAEMRAIMDACRNDRERRAIYLTACSGLRNREIRLLEGRHFARPGFIWVSPDIGKGGRERWLPVSPDLQPVVEEIIRNVALDQLVLPSLRSFNPGVNTDMRPVRRARPLSPDGLIALISGIAERAGIAQRITPHALRHYFGQTVTTQSGIHVARALLGHQSIQTTQIYAGEPSLDDLTRAVGEIEFRLSAPTMAVSPAGDRIRVNSSQYASGQAQALGLVMVQLRERLRPLLFGMGGAHA
jgi:integrase/recombinase XerD